MQSRDGYLEGGTGATECTSQRVGKNLSCQQTRLNRRCICRFYPRAARYILYPLYPPQVPSFDVNYVRAQQCKVFTEAAVNE
jgi:hypothetical protein